MSALSETEIQSHLDFAASVAQQAGRRLLSLRASGRWTDEQVLGDVGDQAADGFLQGFVRGRHPEHGLLSEETVDDAARFERSAVWIVDPLDGTKEYRSGRHDWAIHVGLGIDGRPALGAVAMPAIGRVLCGVCLPGRERVFVLGEHGHRTGDIVVDDGPPADRPLRLAVSRSHTPEWIQRFGTALGGAQLVPSGSVGFKVAMLLFGEADVYVHNKGLKEWDTCAPEAVARAAGWQVCRFDGSEQRYNQRDPRNDEIVVCRPWLRERVLATLAAHAPRA